MSTDTATPKKSNLPRVFDVLRSLLTITITAALTVIVLINVLWSKWFGTFMSGPGGGAVVTVIGTSTIGALTYLQGQRRLQYERERDHLERAEIVRGTHYEEEKNLLLRLMDLVIRFAEVAELAKKNDVQFSEKYNDLHEYLDSHETSLLVAELTLIYPDAVILHELSRMQWMIDQIDQTSDGPQDTLLLDMAISSLSNQLSLRITRLRNPAANLG